MSEKQSSLSNRELAGVPNIEEKQREKLLILFRTCGISDEMIDPNAPVDLEGLKTVASFFPGLLRREDSYNKSQAVKMYFTLARDLGPSPSNNPNVVEIVSNLKEQVRSKPELLKYLQQLSRLNWLNDVEIKDMGFFDNVNASLSMIIQRIYYPERFKYLMEGLVENEELSIDEIYTAYLTFLQRHIEFGRNKGYSEDKRASADSLGTYLDLYRKLTDE